MTYLHPAHTSENAADAIIRVLIEELPAEISAIMGEEAAEDIRRFGEQLDAPNVAEEDYLFDAGLLIKHFPAINIVPRDGSNPAQQQFQCKINLTVQCLIRDLGTGRVPRILRRYMAAIKNVLTKHHSLKGAVKRGRVVSDDPREEWLYTSESGHFFRRGDIHYECHILNKYP